MTRTSTTLTAPGMTRTDHTTLADHRRTDVDRDAAFERVVADCYDDLLGLAWLLTNDQQWAEDAVAEALAKSLRRWRKRPFDNPPAYLRRAVVNEVNSAFRRLRTERRHREHRHGDDRGQRADTDQLADADAIGSALAKLPKKQRTAVVLMYYHDLSQAEAAEVMGCSVGAVKSNCSRGIGRLRALLDGTGDAR